MWAFAKAFGFTFFVAGFLKVFQDLLTFANPQILRFVQHLPFNTYYTSRSSFECVNFMLICTSVCRLLINFIREHSEDDLWEGFVYAALLFFTAILQSLFLHQYFHRCMLVGMRLKTAVIYAVYKKVRIHPSILASLRLCVCTLCV